MPKIIFNENGLPIGIGESGIELTDIQWHEFINNAGKRKWDGSAVVEYTPPAITFPVVESIKSLAGKVILSIAPDYRQRNMLARAIEVADAKAQGVATEQDIAESESIRAVWARIKAIRAKSDELEVQYLAIGSELTVQDLETIKAALEVAGE